MAGNLPNRLISFVLLAASAALCQQDRRSANSLPDAPLVQTDTHPETFRTILDTSRLPLDTLSPETVEHSLRFDPGHFMEEQSLRKQPAASSSNALFLVNRPASMHASTSGGFLTRVAEAASGIVLTRDNEGNRKLNTPYLMRVLTASVAHSAYRPYWRRSATQPFSDFGSTVGSDAGMNVFHEFEPGILQLVKNHEPRFVSKIQDHVSRR